MISGTETAHLFARNAALIPEARLPAVEAKIAADLNLRDGQVIQATLQASLQSLKFTEWDMRLPLTAAQAAIFARWTAPDGETLKLRVQVTPNGSILLRPMPATAQAGPEPDLTTELVNPQATRLAQLIVRQSDVRALTDLLKPGVLDGLLQSTALAVDSDARQKLLASLRLRPSTINLTGERVRDWVKHLGMDLENALLTGKSVSPATLKWGLRALLDELAGDDSGAAHRVQQALDDLEASQLMAGQFLPGREWTLTLLLPFRDANPVLIRFSRGQAQSESESESEPAPMTIQLHTESAQLGEVWLQTRIQELRKVDMMMWTTNEGLATQARAHSGTLGQELADLGLTMTGMQVIHGRRPEEAAASQPLQTAERGHLLDLRT